MIDLIYLIIVLLMGSQLAKLSISGTAYALLLSSTVIFVLASSLSILNNPEVSQVTSGMARPIEQFGVGDPDTWRHNSKTFRDVIDGCYYLMFFNAALCLFISVSHEGKRMEIIRRNKNIGLLPLISILGLIIIFYWDVGGRGFTSKRIMSYYNSEFSLLCIETAVIYLAVYTGKALRAIFNKQI
jgi:hypothetical protein